MKPEEIRRLEQAVESKEQTEFAEEYPEAPEWAKEAAQQIENKERQLQNHLTRRDRQLREKMEDHRTDLRLKVARIAAAKGVATREEKQLLKSTDVETDGESSQYDDLDDRAKFFTPKSEFDYSQ